MQSNNDNHIDTPFMTSEFRVLAILNPSLKSIMQPATYSRSTLSTTSTRYQYLVVVTE